MLRCSLRQNWWTDRYAVWGLCRLTRMGQRTRNYLLDGDKVGRIHVPPRGVTRQRCGISSKFFDHLLVFFLWPLIQNRITVFLILFMHWTSISGFCIPRCIKVQFHFLHFYAQQLPKRGVNRPFKPNSRNIETRISSKITVYTQRFKLSKWRPNSEVMWKIINSIQTWL